MPSLRLEVADPDYPWRKLEAARKAIMDLKCGLSMLEYHIQFNDKDKALSLISRLRNEINQP